MAAFIRPDAKVLINLSMTNFNLQKCVETDLKESA